MGSRSNRAVSAVTAAMFALTTAGIAPAFAAPRAKAMQAAPASSVEFSSRNRNQARSDAAAAAMFGAIIAGVATYAAAREYRKAREYDYYPYRYGYAPYGYYGGSTYRGYKYKPGRNYGYVPYQHKYSGSRLMTKDWNGKKGKGW
ncbi:MAG: hypothetical protein HXY30_07100 [Pseudorhodoplanes sp.]|nr:hypothetical protein [Pseudorhodoplanes sp.]